MDEINIEAEIKQNKAHSGGALRRCPDINKMKTWLHP